VSNQKRMRYSLLFRTDATILCLLLFAGCILIVILGRFLRSRYVGGDEQESRGGVNSLLGALFGLWGFILAFTFGNSASRFDGVRNIMVDEANSIRNAVFRSRVFSDSVGNGFRADLKKYVEIRIHYYDNVRAFDKFRKTKEDAAAIGDSLWARTVRVSYQPNMVAASNNMFASLTSMFDLAVKRDAVLRSGVPELIIYMLFFLALAISFLGGFTTPTIKRKEWFVITGFILLACVIIYITLDLGRPMRG
jgi:hypothetical protein